MYVELLWLLSTFPKQFHLLRCTWQLINIFISLCHFNHSLVCHYQLPSNPQYRFQAFLGSPSYSSGCPHLPQPPECTSCLLQSVPNIFTASTSKKSFLFDPNVLLQVQLHMTQQNKHTEIQKKFGQQQVQLQKAHTTYLSAIHVFQSI